MNKQEIEMRLEQLRREWVENKDKRKILEVQAKLLKIALKIQEENSPAQKQLLE